MYKTVASPYGGTTELCVGYHEVSLDRGLIAFKYAVRRNLRIV